MTRAKKKAVRNLFKNGNLWWTRVRTPDGKVAKRSTGTADRAVAERVVAMLGTVADQRHYDLLAAARDGRLPLLRLYDAFLHMRLDALRAELADVDLSPYVEKWLADLRRNPDVADKTKAVYESQVRTLFPEGAAFPRSALTATTVGEWLAGLDVSSSTRRRYFDALRAFVGWAVRRDIFAADPLAKVAPPANAPPRMVWWEWDVLQRVLAAMPKGEARSCILLIAGTGMESGAALAAKGADVQQAHRSVWAHGTKNGYRSRACFVSAWAWKELGPYCRSVFPNARLFPSLTADSLRDAFKAAQVALGICSADAGRGQWHDVHALRHTFCYIRLLGLDGEPKADLQYCADQLGHADTVMVSRIYGKFRMRERIVAQQAHERQHAEAM